MRLFPAGKATFGADLLVETFSGMLAEGVPELGSSPWLCALSVPVFHELFFSCYIGCGALTSDVADKIALLKRGNCTFTEKALAAQHAGAVVCGIVQSSRLLMYVRRLCVDMFMH